MFKIDKDWKDIYARAWSVRFMILAMLLSAGEAVVPYFNVPWYVYGGVVALAFWSRSVAQEGLPG